MGPTTKKVLIGTGIVLAGSAVVGCKDEVQKSNSAIDHLSPQSGDNQLNTGFFANPLGYELVAAGPGIVVGSRLLYQGNDEDAAYLRDRYGIVPLRLYSQGEFRDTKIRTASPGHLDVVDVPSTQAKRDLLQEKRTAGQIDLRHPTFTLTGEQADSLQAVISRASAGQFGVPEIWVLEAQGVVIVPLITSSAQQNPRGYLRVMEIKMLGGLNEASWPDAVTAIEQSAGSVLVR